MQIGLSTTEYVKKRKEKLHLITQLNFDNTH